MKRQSKGIRKLGFTYELMFSSFLCLLKTNAGNDVSETDT